ncbi:hypothetical protein ACWF94_12405 [Streptomyces sp. NPDC055078]
MIELHKEADPVAELEGLFAALPADKMLGPTLERLRGRMRCSEETAGTLRRARLGRNFIAHEGAAVGDISLAREGDILVHATRLRSAVLDLADGDNIVSRWGYSIEEPRGYLPLDLINAYPEMIDEWVFGHFEDLPAL